VWMSRIVRGVDVGVDDGGYLRFQPWER
jgi:hypothetical protein